jgi:antagonist of KipI
MSDAAIEIVNPGLLSSVQDQGRRDVGRLGVSPCGAADWLSARCANRLVANPPGAALIETTMTGISFKALTDTLVAVTGADAQLSVSGVAAPLWCSIPVPAGSEVSVGAAERGLRSYVAFHGGIDVPLMLGSASTDLTAGFGGIGRALARGDLLALKTLEQPARFGGRAIASARCPRWHEPATLRVLPGPHAKRLTPSDRSALCSQTYRVSTRTNRQGARLEGRSLAARDGFDVVSCGVSAGCVQVSSDGLPIVLLADHQTTGGYAVPLTVVTADLPDAAQLRPGDELRFSLIAFATASAALTEKMRALTEALDEPNPAS